MRLIVVVGARPNVVKVSSLIPELERAGIECDIAFTGTREAASAHDEHSCPQNELDFYGVCLPAPRWYLDVGAGSAGSQTGHAMMAFEGLLGSETPDAVMVVGDVNATLAAAISAAKAGIPVVHLEAGLRCGDLRVPEEINRVIIARIAALHLAPTERALEDLEDEGIEPERIFFVGDMMAESVLRHLDHAEHEELVLSLGLVERGYVLASFHRPENLGDPERFRAIVAGLGDSPLPVVLLDTEGFAATAAESGVAIPARVRVLPAVSYHAMLALQRDAAVVITDSGGIQEESCVIGTPCVTVRDTTEHGVTLEVGANRLCAAERGAIVAALDATSGARRDWVIPRRWDRAVSDRIVRVLRRGVTPLC